MVVLTFEKEYHFIDNRTQLPEINQAIPSNLVEIIDYPERIRRQRKDKTIKSANK